VSATQRFQRDAWLDARTQAAREPGLEDLPEDCPFAFDEGRDPDFWPE